MGGLPVGRFLNQAVEDIRTISQVVRLLPEIAGSLAAIEKSVHTMATEVQKMRQGVDRLSEQVEPLTEGITGMHDDLDARMASVLDGVSRLEGPIQEIGTSLRPWRRARGRLGLAGAPAAPSDVAPEAADSAS